MANLGQYLNPREMQRKSKQAGAFLTSIFNPAALDTEGNQVLQEGFAKLPQNIQQTVRSLPIEGLQQLGQTKLTQPSIESAKKITTGIDRVETQKVFEKKKENIFKTLPDDVNYNLTQIQKERKDFLDGLNQAQKLGFEPEILNVFHQRLKDLDAEELEYKSIPQRIIQDNPDLSPFQLKDLENKIKGKNDLLSKATPYLELPLQFGKAAGEQLQKIPEVASGLNEAIINAPKSILEGLTRGEHERQSKLALQELSNPQLNDKQMAGAMSKYQFHQQFLQEPQTNYYQKGVQEAQAITKKQNEALNKITIAGQPLGQALDVNQSLASNTARVAGNIAPYMFNPIKVSTPAILAQKVGGNMVANLLRAGGTEAIEDALLNGIISEGDIQRGVSEGTINPKDINTERIKQFLGNTFSDVLGAAALKGTGELLGKGLNKAVNLPQTLKEGQIKQNTAQAIRQNLPEARTQKRIESIQNATEEKIPELEQKINSLPETPQKAELIQSLNEKKAEFQTQKEYQAQNEVSEIEQKYKNLDTLLKDRTKPIPKSEKLNIRLQEIESDIQSTEKFTSPQALQALETRKSLINEKLGVEQAQVKANTELQDLKRQKAELSSSKPIGEVKRLAKEGNLDIINRKIAEFESKPVNQTPLKVNENIPEVQTQKPIIAETPVSAKIPSISIKSPDNVKKTLYEAGRKIFELDKNKAVAHAVISDSIIKQIARRDKLAGSKLFRELEFRKGTPEELEGKAGVKYQADDGLINEARKYKSAKEFVDAHIATNLMDLSDPNKHRLGRLFEDGIDEDTGKYMDAKLTADIYGKRGNNEYKYQKDANVPDVNSKEDLVTIYRGTVKAQKNILPGDFVTFSKDYALMHNNGEKLLTQKVPAKDVVFQGNDFNEWIYSPEALRGEKYNGGLTEVWNKANTPTTKANNPDIRFQGQKGAMLEESGKDVIYALTDPNVSTPLHELAHVYERVLHKTEIKTIENWANAKRGTTDFSEKFARGFEKYLSEGKAPTKELEKIFERFKTWLTDIYNGIKGSEIDLKLNDEMRKIYDEMLGKELVSNMPANPDIPKQPPVEIKPPKTPIPTGKPKLEATTDQQITKQLKTEKENLKRSLGDTKTSTFREDPDMLRESGYTGDIRNENAIQEHLAKKIIDGTLSNEHYDALIEGSSKTAQNKLNEFRGKRAELEAEKGLDEQEKAIIEVNKAFEDEFDKMEKTPRNIEKLGDKYGNNELLTPENQNKWKDLLFKTNKELGVKERGLSKRTKEQELFDENIQEKFKDDYLDYEVKTQKYIKENADKVVSDYDSAIKAKTDIEDRIKRGKPFTAEDEGVMIRAIDEFRKAGDDELTFRMIEDLAEKLTNAGQVIAHSKLIAKMTPEDVIRKAKLEIDKMNNPKLQEKFNEKVGEIEEKMTEFNKKSGQDFIDDLEKWCPPN